MISKNESETRSEKPGLLVVSHVLPFPPSAGQNQRVHYTLLALRERFRVGFLTFQPRNQMEDIQRQLREWVDEPIVLPSLTKRNLRHRALGSLYSAATGLKRSNYAIGQVEFDASRVERSVDLSRFEIALFEYWHAWKASPLLRRKGILTVLDMHDVLWRSYERQLDQQSRAPRFWKRYALERYRAAEEKSWSAFDALIAINREEEEEARSKAGPNPQIFYAPMGTDLKLWPYSYHPQDTPRFAFYGSMGSPRNQEFARRCAERIMPILWRGHPETEFWIVGGKPPDSIKSLCADPRIKVTGFVPDVQPLLATMTAILCPWRGTYGFRSRLIETMALGVPIVANPDAVAGMELERDSGVLLADDDQGLADHALRLLEDRPFALQESRQARAKAESIYGLEPTYGRMTRELADWLNAKRNRA